MLGPQIKTSTKVIPMIYAYTTPNDISHMGWTKIGYTEKQSVEDRIKQQTHTSDTAWNLEWKKTAVYDDGSGETFKDTDFHSYLRKKGIENKKSTEWFKITGEKSKSMLIDFKETRGELTSISEVVPYTLRAEQIQAVKQTKEYFETHKNPEFLWNAKPRFGKTLSVYDLCKQLKAQNVLIVTNRPAIANSWYSDYIKFLGESSGYKFVSDTSYLKDKIGVLSRKQYVESLSIDGLYNCIEFISLQDLKGSLYFGGKFYKLEEVSSINWDILVIDEAHEGVDTYKTDIALDHIKRKYTLHLSGTPFKALSNDKFNSDAIYNWTYADEQKSKKDWSDFSQNNPYENLPRLNLFTYQMSEIIEDKIKKGIEIDGKIEEYAFDLNDFFATKPNGEFVHSQSVDKFLYALTTLKKYPFSTKQLRNELKHTLWLLNRVDSAKALAKKLREHPIFNQYEIVLVAGDGKLNPDDEVKKSYDKVINAVNKFSKTITISVGQLTTGITIPEWTGVLMLSNVKSPALYMQTAFRVQNPWKYQENGECFVKENAYVFDFDPARTLVIFEEFANDLSANTSNSKGNTDLRKENVRELLNFFPVIGEDDNGGMIELDAEKVLSIPRKIRSQEVVKRGFMSNFIFQNVFNIFNAPQEVINIIQTLEPVSEGELIDVSKSTRDSLSINDNGEVEIPNEYVINKSKELFGDKIYETFPKIIEDKIEDVIQNNSDKKNIKKLQDTFKEDFINPIMDITTKTYSTDLKPKDEKQIRKALENKTDSIINKEYGNYNIELNTLENDRKLEILNATKLGIDTTGINQKFDAQIQEVKNNFKDNLSQKLEDAMPSLGEDIVKTVETKKNERQKETIEDAIRNHLRGFARTIPSFLMAYGDENTTLSNFDNIIPNDVFKEVTSITIDEFKFLRDGGYYFDEDTQTEKWYEGNLFDPVVFNDSIKEFLNLKEKLANYFDETQENDIFDYIPPQKTNQIFTPKDIVKKMVDLLEEENPGCFDDPNKTFMDLYMKSGLYIAEIVKRLYNSSNIKMLYPNSKDRLNHIFKKQVYGLAPTEIIYRISINFILGFDNSISIDMHNFKLFDSLVYAKEGLLNEKLDEIYSIN